MIGQARVYLHCVPVQTRMSLEQSIIHVDNMLVFFFLMLRNFVFWYITNVHYFQSVYLLSFTFLLFFFFQLKLLGGKKTQFLAHESAELSLTH